MKLIFKLEVSMNNSACPHCNDVEETVRLIHRAANLLKRDGLAVGYTEILRDCEGGKVGSFIVTDKE